MPARWSDSAERVLDGLGAPGGVRDALRGVAGYSLMLAGAGLVEQRQRRLLRGVILPALDAHAARIEPWYQTLDRGSQRRLRQGLMQVGIPVSIIASLTGCPLRGLQQAARRAALTNLLVVRRASPPRHPR